MEDQENDSPATPPELPGGRLLELQDRIQSLESMRYDRAKLRAEDLSDDVLQLIEEIAERKARALIGENGRETKPRQTRLKNWHVFIACSLMAGIGILAVVYPDAIKPKIDAAKALFKTRGSHLEDARQLALKEQRGWVQNGARVAVIRFGYEDSKGLALRVSDRGIGWIADHENSPTDADARQWFEDAASELGIRPSPYADGRSHASMLIATLDGWRHFQQKEWFEDKFSPHLDG